MSSPIRVRSGAGRYTVTVLSRDTNDPARRIVYKSAIQALHAIRVLVVTSGRVFEPEDTAATRAAFEQLCACARDEIAAAESAILRDT